MLHACCTTSQRAALRQAGGQDPGVAIHGQKPAPSSWIYLSFTSAHMPRLLLQAGCDAATIQPWNPNVYAYTPHYAPQDPFDHGGPAYGEAIWMTGAVSPTLGAALGSDASCCGMDLHDNGGGCGRCMLLRNPQQARNVSMTAIVMKKSCASQRGAEPPCQRRRTMSAPALLLINGLALLSWSMVSMPIRVKSPHDRPCLMKRNVTCVGAMAPPCADCPPDDPVGTGNPACNPGLLHLDVAVPGFDYASASTASVCGARSREQTYITREKSQR